MSNPGQRKEKNKIFQKQHHVNMCMSLSTTSKQRLKKAFTGPRSANGFVIREPSPQEVQQTTAISAANQSTNLSSLLSEGAAAAMHRRMRRRSSSVREVQAWREEIGRLEREGGTVDGLDHIRGDERTLDERTLIGGR